MYRLPPLFTNLEISRTWKPGELTLHFQHCFNRAASYRIWTPRSWWCALTWRRCMWNSAGGRQVWWWASDGICQMGWPKKKNPNTSEEGRGLASLQNGEPSPTRQHIPPIKLNKRNHKTKGTHPTRYIPVHCAAFTFPSVAFFLCFEEGRLKETWNEMHFPLKHHVICQLLMKAAQLHLSLGCHRVSASINNVTIMWSTHQRLYNQF